jgi:hypothetical protein
MRSLDAKNEVGGEGGGASLVCFKQFVPFLSINSVSFMTGSFGEANGNQCVPYSVGCG